MNLSLLFIFYIELRKHVIDLTNISKKAWIYAKLLLRIWKQLCKGIEEKIFHELDVRVSEKTTMWFPAIFKECSLETFT